MIPATAYVIQLVQFVFGLCESVRSHSVSLPDRSNGPPQSNGKNHEDSSRGLDEHHRNAKCPHELQSIRVDDLRSILKCGKSC